MSRESAVDAEAPLERSVRRGLMWSFANTAVSRLGTFLAGIVIARIIAPEQFGVYAVALVALNVMLSANELGVSVALVRHPGSVAAIAPTVMTLSIASSAVVFLLAELGAPLFASAMGAPEATGLVQLIAVAVLIDGIAAVPVAILTRRFLQGVRMRIDLIAFLVGTPLTIALAMLGFGAWSLAWGSVAGNVVTAVLALVWTPERYRPGWDRAVAASVIRFGLPLAGSSLLLLVLVNVDFVVVGRLLGTEQLGFYLLAFNLSAWPMMLVSTVVRRITTAAFARMHERGDGPEGFRRAFASVMGLGVLLSALLAAFATPLVVFLYGETWAPAAVAVPALVLLSLARMLIELVYDYLVACGRPIGNIWLHAVWLVVLVPALWLATEAFGIGGTAAAHALVAVVVVVPGALLLLRGAGVRVGRLLGDLVLPAVGAAAVVVVAVVTGRAGLTGFVELAVGGSVATLVYAAIVGPSFLRSLRRLRSGAGARGSDGAARARHRAPRSRRPQPTP